MYATRTCLGKSGVIIKPVSKIGKYWKIRLHWYNSSLLHSNFQSWQMRSLPTLDNIWCWKVVKWDFLRYFHMVLNQWFWSHWFYMTSDLWCKSSSCDHWDVFSRSLGRTWPRESLFISIWRPFFSRPSSCLNASMEPLLLQQQPSSSWSSSKATIRCCLQRKQLDKVWLHYQNGPRRPMILDFSTATLLYNYVDFTNVFLTFFPLQC